MNEQAIIDSYNIFKSNGYKKSLDEYKTLLNSNPDALNDSYNLFKSNGYKKSIDEYKSLMGVGGVVKKKESTLEASESISTSQAEPSSLDTKPKKEQKPSVSSGSKDSKDIFTGYPGKEGKKYKLDKSSGYPVWKEYSSTTMKKDGQVENYDKTITDVDRVTALNKHFGIQASTSDVDEVFTGYPGKEKNQYRVKDNKWQRLAEGTTQWQDIVNEGSIGSLNNRYSKQVSVPIKTPPAKKDELMFTDINSKLISKTEEEVVPYLQKKYGKLGFTFDQAGFGTDYVNVTSKDGKSIQVGLDENNSEEVLKLRNFLSQNQSKDSALDVRRFEVDSKDYNNALREADIVDIEKEIRDRIFDAKSGVSTAPITSERISAPKKDKETAKKLVDDVYKSEAYKIYQEKKKQQYTEQERKIDGLYYELKNAKNPIDKKNVKAKIETYLSKEVIGDQTKNYDYQLSDVKNSFSKLKSAEEKLVSDVNELKSMASSMSEEEYNVQLESFNKRYEYLDSRRQELVNQGTEITSQMKKLETVAGKYILTKEKTGSFGGAFLNSAVTGFSKILEPMVNFIDKEQDMLSVATPEDKKYIKDNKFTDEQAENFLQNKRTKELREQVRSKSLDLLGSKGTTEEFTKSSDRGFIEGALLGVAESLPSMLMPGGAVLKTTAMGLVAFSSIEEEMLNDKDFETVSATERAAVAVPYAVGMGILENLGFSAIVSKNPIAKSLVLGSISGAAKKIGGEATSEVFEKILEGEIKSNIAKFGIRVVGGALAEAETGATQSLVLDIGLKSVYNAIKSSGMSEEEISKLSQGEFFDTPDSFWEGVKQVVSDGVAEAIGGAAMTAAMTGFQGIVNGNISLYDQKDVEFLKEMSSDNELKKLFKAKLKTDMLNGSLTKSEAKSKLDSFNTTSANFNSIPDNVTGEDLKTSMGLLSEKQKIEQEIAGKDENLVAAQKARIAEINNELQQMSQKTSTVEEQEVVEAELTPLELEENKIEDGNVQEVTPEIIPGERAIISGIEIVYPTEQEKTDRINFRSTAEFVEEASSDLPVEDINAFTEELGGEFGLLTAENPLTQPLTEQENKSLTQEAVKWLESKGYKPRRVTGKYGQGENSLFVPNLSKNDAIAFAKEFNQESVAHSEGLVYQDGSMNPRVKANDDFSFSEYNPESDLVSVIKTPDGLKTFSVGYDTENKVTSTEQEVEAIGELISGTEQEIDQKAANIVNKKISKAVAKAAKAVSKIIPTTKFIVHDTDASYRAATNEEGAGQSSNGEFNPTTNTIHINATKANARTIAHEVFHAILINRVKTESEASSVTKRMIDAITPSLDVDTKAFLEYFSSNYDENIQNEEKMAELFGVLSESYNNATNRVKDIIARWIDRMAKILGLDPFNRNETLDILKSMARKVAKGEVISESDVNIIGSNLSVKEKQQVIDSMISRNQQPVKGNVLFNESLPEATEIADKYAESKGMRISRFQPVTKLDENNSRAISKEFDKMKDDPTNKEVKRSYEQMVKETIEQYEAIIKEGYVVEINNNEPYSNSSQMIEDLRKNKRMNIFSTESGFGDVAITDEQRELNPLLKDSGFKDKNGVTLLANDVFRFVHDFFGHAKMGNSFGPIGEENAWMVHSEMYSPLARRAMTTETRGQNSWVNFSGVNKKAFELRDKARALRKEGKTEQADALVGEVYDMMRFADQKIGLMPEWTSEVRKQKDVEVKGEMLKLTTTKDGDFVFHHYSDKRRDAIKPGTGQNIITSKEESGALSSVGGLAMFYAMDNQVEPGVGNVQHTVVVPMDKVYDFNKDPDNFFDEAKKRFEKARPSQSFGNPNYQLAFITQVANENGYDMVIAKWRNNELRAQTTKSLKPLDNNIPMKPIAEETYKVGDDVEVYGSKGKITSIDGDIITFKGEGVGGQINFKRFPKNISKQITSEADAKKDADGIQEVIGTRKQLSGKINEIVKLSKDQGFSDAGIRAYLKQQGYTDKQSTAAINEYNIKKEDIYISKDGGIPTMMANSFRSLKKRFFSARGFLAKSTFASKENKEALVSKHLNIVSQNVKDFNRLYKSYKGDKDAMLSNFDAYLRGDKTVVLTEELREVANSMRNQIDGLSRELISMGIVDADTSETIFNNLGSYLTRSYEVFDNKNYKKKIEQETIQKAKNMLRQEYQQMAQDIATREDIPVDEVLDTLVDNAIDEMISNEGSSFISGSKLGAKDMSIFKQKKDIPIEIRMLLGEYSDPGLNYAKTVLKLSSVAANHKFLTEVKNSGTGSFLFEKNDPRRPKDFNVKIAADGSSAMAPLNGMYTTKEIADAFMAQPTQLNNALKLFMKVQSSVRWAKTIGSVATHIKNIFGNLGFVFINGHFDMNELSDSYKVVMNDLKKGSDKQKRDKMNYYISLGIVKQSAGLGEIMDMFKDADWDTAMASRLSNKKLSLAQRAKKALLQGKKGLEDAYQAEDDFFKIIAYENELSRYSKAIYGKDKSKLSESELNTVNNTVVEIVKNTYPTYDRIPEAIKMIRRTPFIGNFVSFQAESYRTAYNTMAITKSELSSDNPAIKRIGAQRLAGASTYITAKSSILIYFSKMAGMGMTGLAGYLMNDDEEDEKGKDVRRFVAPWSKKSDLLMLDSKPGEIRYIDFSASDPHGGIKKAMNAFFLGESIPESFGASLLESVTPFIGEDMVVSSLLALKNNQDPYGNPIYNKEESLDDKMKKISSFVFKLVEPGTVSSIRRGLKADDKINELVANITGLRTYSVDIKDQAGYAIKDISERITDAKKIYNSVYFNEESTESQKNAAYKEADKALNSIYSEVIDIYNASERLGVSPEDIEQQFKDFGRISKEKMSEIKAGEIEPLKTKEEQEQTGQSRSSRKGRSLVRRSRR
jgi:hypothetical protein